jgi:hypothetical protein
MYNKQIVVRTKLIERLMNKMADFKNYNLTNKNWDQGSAECESVASKHLTYYIVEESACFFLIRKIKFLFGTFV